MAFFLPALPVVELAHRASRGLQHLIQLLPAVDLLQLRVPDELDVEDGERSGAFQNLPPMLEHHREGGKAGEAVEKELLVAQVLGDAGGDLRPLVALPAPERTPDPAGQLLRSGGEEHPLIHLRFNGFAGLGRRRASEDQCRIAGACRRTQLRQLIDCGSLRDDQIGMRPHPGHQGRVSIRLLLSVVDGPQIGAEFGRGRAKYIIQPGVPHPGKDPHEGRSRNARFRFTFSASSCRSTGLVR